MRIKKGDNVIVIAGAHKGATGKVARVLTAQHRAVVEGVGKVKRHKKAKKRDEKGSIVEHEMPLHLSNLMLVEGGTRTRTGKKRVGEQWVRISKKSGKEI
ncbi:MAG TPA: 50S ribosomal protein L24 [Candidatus Paceibacterota bacterium]|jgi:large subunit ribosomal protein L24|nr:50S ribosomal protein L24 [Candidatus Paceibacterota bacterium]